jgi:hypothetical protein
MNSGLSFAQILQKKKTNDANNPHGSASRTPTPNQMGGQQHRSPTLEQLMSEYTEYPEGPESNYTLSFSSHESLG